MTKKHNISTGELRLEIEPFGATADQLAPIGRSVLAHKLVRKALAAGKCRLLGVAAIDPEADGRKSAKPCKPDRFRATIYDYSNARTLLVEGRIAAPEDVEISESAEQPPVTFEEFGQAVQTLTRHEAFSARIERERLSFYRPMPPLIDAQEADGRTQRLIGVGIFSPATRQAIEILGVDLLDGRLHRFDERAPLHTRPRNNTICGVPVDANQPTASKGTAGQVWITVKQGQKTLWRFLAIRPAASSGLAGSGVELRFVDYRGKRVLYRGHVPILNVKYDGNACGPYRDWQYEEGQIQAAGADVAPGFRLCPAPAKTIADTGSDTGNFLGVGIYVDGQEVVLVSEMEAGWYRYISEWRLHANGRIRPRFTFAATESQCVCNVHHHHAYWRLDFDILTAGNNRFLEFNDPPLGGGGNWHQKHFEIARPRNPASKRRWKVEHGTSGTGYEIVPGHHDGVASQMPDAPYGRGDVWLLRYRGSEIDDGVPPLGSPSEANIGAWVNGEAILGQDIVMWYGAHFSHDVSHQDPASHGHILGPDLIPVKWPA